jgi:hypothetical protein
MTVSRLNPWWRAFCVATVTLVGATCLPAVAQADFGLLPGSVSAVASNKDGTITSQAGSHPYSYTVGFQLKTDADGHDEGGELRDVIVDLPPGLIGNPLAGPRCPRALFEGITPNCPPDTQVGILHALVVGLGEAFGPVYNMVAPPGVGGQLGFSALSNNALQNVSVRTSEGYGLRVSTSSIPLEISSATVTVWGVPADPGHDAQRGKSAAEGQGPPVASDAPLLPFLTLPASCDAPLRIAVRVDSRLAPGVFDEQSAVSLDGGGNPAALGGCGAVPFSPQILAQPTSGQAESSSGLGFELKLPEQGFLSPGGIAETEPEKVEVALPEGVTANPSAAEGLGSCTEAQYQAEGPETGPGEGCPESSKVGSLVASSPVLDEPIEGSLYLAKPYQNPTGTLIGLYIVARARERGVMIKQAGRVEPDPRTGRLLTTFEGLPPLPYSDFSLHFREGARSLLVTPPACGRYQTTARLTPFSAPSTPYVTSASFQIESGVHGGPCPTGGVPPFAPRVLSGTNNNAAGAYSPLYLRLTREDGEQELTRFSTTLPPGLSGNLTGIPFCPDAAIEAARTHTGVEESQSPSCPAASQVGHTSVGAGVGTVLAQTPGRLYLAGPYHGAPLSLVSVTSATVGPFDLGTVVIRFGLRINPSTAQVEVDASGSDPIPHIIKGIVVHVRDIRAYVDRPDFTLNPTNCDRMSIVNTVTGAGADFTNPADAFPVTLTSPFQAADCASLAFKPTFAVSTSGKTSKANGASLTVKLAYPNAPQGTQANIHQVKVELPKQLPSRLTTLQKACTAAQFHTNPAGCPAASVVGHARAITPILPVPLEGPAYFVSNGGEAFPNLIMVLQGYGITIDLVGSTFINKQGITSSTFKTVPDQPVTSFELTLPQGPYSALAANGNLCTSKLKMPTEFVGQNGALLTQTTKVSITGCPKTKALTRAQKLALALKACHKKHGAKRKACERAARKKYAPVKAKKAKKK